MTLTNSNSHTPCRMADTRVSAPASTLAPERTMTPVIGSTPRTPQMALPTPCAASSRSYLVRGPRCIWSTAVAHSSVSALAMKAMEMAPTRIGHSVMRASRSQVGKIVTSQMLLGTLT